MELERFPKAMPLREEREACRGVEEPLSPWGGPRHPPVSAAACRAAWLRAPTRPPGRSGGTSDTMAWLEGSLVMVAGRLPPALLDMSKVGLRHRRRAESAELHSPPHRSCPRVPPPQAPAPHTPAHHGPPSQPTPRPQNQRSREPTYFCKSSLELSSGTCPVTGCRNVFRLSLWLRETAAGRWLASPGPGPFPKTLCL